MVEGSHRLGSSSVSPRRRSGFPGSPRNRRASRKIVGRPRRRPGSAPADLHVPVDGRRRSDPRGRSRRSDGSDRARRALQRGGRDRRADGEPARRSHRLRRCRRHRGTPTRRGTGASRGSASRSISSPCPVIPTGDPRPRGAERPDRDRSARPRPDRGAGARFDHRAGSSAGRRSSVLCVSVIAGPKSHARLVSRLQRDREDVTDDTRRDPAITSPVSRKSLPAKIPKLPPASRMSAARRRAMSHRRETELEEAVEGARRHVRGSSAALPASGSPWPRERALGRSRGIRRSSRAPGRGTRSPGTLPIFRDGRSSDALAGCAKAPPRARRRATRRGERPRPRRR